MDCWPIAKQTTKKVAAIEARVPVDAGRRRQRISAKNNSSDKPNNHGVGDQNALPVGVDAGALIQSDVRLNRCPPATSASSPKSMLDCGSTCCSWAVGEVTTKGCWRKGVAEDEV